MRNRRERWLALGLFLVLYGPARFVMDALRVGDARYLGWTPGQYASIVASLAGLTALLYAASAARVARGRGAA